MKMVKNQKILLVIIFSCILASLFLNPVLAGYDWIRYGGSYSTTHTNAQSPSLVGRLNSTNIINISTLNGFDFNYYGKHQPKVRAFANISGENSRLIFPNGNYIYLYDSNLILQNQFYTGATALGELQIADFNYDGDANEIIGLYEAYPNQITFRDYQYNSTTTNLQLINEINFSYLGANKYSGGVNCLTGTSNGFCVFTLINESYSQFIKLWANLTYQNFSVPTTDTGGFISPPQIRDIDNDGKYEYLIWSSRDLYVIEDGGTIQTKLTQGGTSGFSGATFFKPDGSAFYKIAYITSSTSGGSCTASINTINPDNSTFWSKNIDSDLVGCNFVYNVYGLAVADYNTDNYDDLWLAWQYYINDAPHMKIFKGSDGDLLYSQTTNYKVLLQSTTISDIYPELTLAKVDSDNFYDFILNGNYISNSQIQVWSVGNNELIYQKNLSSLHKCIGADINLDFDTDIICQNESLTFILTSNYSNSLPSITQIIFDPSTSIAVGQTLYAYITATDLESDTLYYAIQCDTNQNISSYDTITTKTCSYSESGIKNLTIYVTDEIYKTTGQYDSYSQEIVVSTSGTTCDNDGICESGENNINCPNDCFASAVNTTQSDLGGMAIPTQLVDTEGNTETGLLPEIYYGILAFLSVTLRPMIIIVFIILFAFIILGFFFVIKKLVNMT